MNTYGHVLEEMKRETARNIDVGCLENASFTVEAKPLAGKVV